MCHLSMFATISGNNKNSAGFKCNTKGTIKSENTVNMVVYWYVDGDLASMG